MEECECAICKNNIMPTNLCKTTCNHMYCLSCLLLHLKNDHRCPLCRANIEDSESSESEDDSSDSEDDESTNNKDLEKIKKFINSDDLSKIYFYKKHYKNIINMRKFINDSLRY